MQKDLETRTRLHISPLTPQLLPLIIPAHLLRAAEESATYHTIQTFPERAYGFVELPEHEAKKLSAKLAGCVLKGVKMRVEPARPGVAKEGHGAIGKDGSTSNEGTPVKDGASGAIRTRRTSRQKPHENVTAAVELPRDRKVKRGWTGSEPVAKEKRKGGKAKDDTKKKRAASISGESECLFKAKLPPNVASDTLGDGNKKKRKRKGEAEVVVHEFANATKFPKFLKDTQDRSYGRRKTAMEFVDGKGWVDDDGHVVEVVQEKRRTRSGRSDRNAPPAAAAPAVQDDEDETSSSGSSSSDTSGSDDNDDIDDVNAKQVQRLSISRSSLVPEDHNNNNNNDNDNDTDMKSSSPAPAAANVHPLEALFKRPQAAASTAASSSPSSSTPAPKTKGRKSSLHSRRPNLEVSTAAPSNSFTFFAPDPDMSATPSKPTASTEPVTAAVPGNVMMMMPQTPFTQQDFRHRRQRSAAPTPDTAAPTQRTFAAADVRWAAGEPSPPASSSSSSPTSDTADNDAGHDGDAKEEGEEDKESEFSKWFYASRGENVRGWKKRRREALRSARGRGRGR